MSTITCPSCQTVSPAGALFCDNCGSDLSGAQPAVEQHAPTVAAETPGVGIVCPTCQHENVPGSAFCDNCGKQLPQQPIPVPQQQTPPPAPQTPQPQADFEPAVQLQPVQEQAADPPLQQQPTPATPEIPAETLSGHLVIQESNVNLQIPAGKQEVVLGREDPVSGIFPDIDLDPYGGQDTGIGRKHAKLTSHGGQTYIEDLNSVNGTVVNKQRIPSGEPVPLGNGDEIRLGLMVLLYYTN